ncbi:hypothetical protein PVAND_000594 [Polypedilum vanderplanki]|uniref:C2H2-type domain-containing protein n=1 Tax=Polypedilum vanderplanki TaxID=319348 RepID=A0A9J6BLR1_POLVA|nr:hypothetical protein PVAND_000594 [Polypedilum vanderplanki]
MGLKLKPEKPKSFVFEYCDKSYTTNAELKTHLRLRCPNSPNKDSREWFHCELCSYKQTDRKKLNKHMKNVHEDNRSDIAKAQANRQEELRTGKTIEQGSFAIRKQ